MSLPVSKPDPYAERLRLPDHVIGEVMAGELYVQPRPATKHTRVASVLGSRIGGPFDYDPSGPGGWIILDEPELHLGRLPDIVVPDLAGWRRTTMESLPDAPAISEAPDWVCEVLSPSTAATDRTIKMEIYARESVGHLWLIDPTTQLLEVYRQGDGWLRIGSWRGQDQVRAEPFAKIELDLASLWLWNTDATST